MPFGWIIVRINGQSMAPALRNGQIVLMRDLRSGKLFASRSNPTVGDIVLAEHPHYGRIVKRVSLIEDNGDVHLRGDNRGASTMPFDLGTLSRAHILGRLRNKETPNT